MMKQDINVVVVLGVIILAIIGVYLSAKTTVKEPALPIPEQEIDKEAGKSNSDTLPAEPFDVVKQVSKSTKPVKFNAEKAAAIKMELKEIDDNVLIDAEEQSKDDYAAVNNGHTPNGAKADDVGWKSTDSGNPTKPIAKEHTVQKGDTLYKLAIKYYHDGEKWKAIQDANRATLKKSTVLRTGQRLIIPDIMIFPYSPE